MKHFTCVCAALAASMLSASETIAPRIPNLAGNLIFAQAPERADADQAWAHLDALIAAIPPYKVTGAFPGKTEYAEGYFLWQEFSNQLLRREGLGFAERYSGDPRVWTWLAAARDRAPRYWMFGSSGNALLDGDGKPLIDMNARAHWSAQSRRLRDLAIESEAAPIDLRVTLWAERINEPIELAAISRHFPASVDNPISAEKIDLLGLFIDLDALGRTFPDRRDPSIRSIAGRLFGFAETYRAAQLAEFRAKLADNPNELISEVAHGNTAMALARVEPIDMKFTAIDGREVDLAKLRGKVVLIEFRGVTWCGACRDEEPSKKAAYAKYRERGFEIITITYENKESSRGFVQNYIKERGLIWPHYFDGLGARNPYIQRFGITAVPKYFLLNQEGLLVSTDVRKGKLKQELEKLLAP